jgi:peroxiredoxin
MDQDGTAQSLADYRGQYVVLEWFNNDCPFVKKHYDSHNMQGLQATLTDEDVAWLTIASSAPGKQGHIDGADAARALIDAREANQTALLLDSAGTVGRAYGAKTTPHMYLLSPEGELLYKGAIDSIASADPADIPEATNYVMQAWEEASAGHPVSVAETQSYGCSVKY